MVQTRRERLREATIEEIKNIARAQMGQHGPANISLRAIAREMGLTAPALYRYFDSYDNLITSLIVDAYSALADTLEAAQDSIDKDDYALQLYIVAHAYRNWALAHPHDYLLIQGSPIPNYQAPEEVTGPPAKRTWRIFLEVLANARAAGVLTLPDAYEMPLPNYEALRQMAHAYYDFNFGIPVLHTAIALWALCHGIVLMELHNHFPAVAAETFELEISQLMKRIGLSLHPSKYPIKH